MALNPSIILAGAQPDLMAAFDSGQVAGERGNQIGTQNALRSLYQTQGQNILAGEQGALNALAAIDPMASLGVQGARQDMAATSQKMKMLTREEQRLIEDRARTLTAAERAAAIAENEANVRAGMATQSPQEWDTLMQRLGATDLIGQFDQREGLARRQMAMADILKQFEPLSPEGKFSVDQARGLIPPGTPSSAGDEDGKARAIRRTMEATGVDYTTAQGVIDGLLKVSQDPTTREIMVTNLITGETYAPTVVQGMPTQGSAGQQAQQPAPVQQTPPPAGNPTFGDAFQGASNSFGFQGVARNIINTAADATGFEVPFPEDQQTRQDFEVLGESLINDFASAYGRQPPSWLLQNIAQLVPQAGRPLEGPQRAQTKLTSIARDMTSRRQAAQAQLSRRLTPAERQEALALIAGIDAALVRVDAALKGFQGGASDADDALMQKYLGGN